MDSDSGALTRKKKRSNQHKPLPPEEDLRPVVKYYWSLGFSDEKIAEHARDHFDLSTYGISKRSVERYRVTWGLLGTRQQKQSFNTITPFVQEIKERFPNMGARQLVSTLRHDYSIKVSEKTVLAYLNLTEPEAVKYRKQKRFRRKRFWSAGVMDIWTCDQHDKWKRFGLWLHVALDPYPGELVWLKVWWTNRNPQLIASYYLEAGREREGVPLVTQSDKGWEMYGVANVHTNIRHTLDQSLKDTLQHRWCGSKMNIKPEAFWSLFRRQFTPGFENLFDLGLNENLYDPEDPVENLLFRWLAIPWLQAEIDTWRVRFNQTPRRADKHKILPHGIPNLISAKPHLYHSRDFKIVVPMGIFDEMEQRWAPRELPVFRLVPPAFEEQLNALYASLGKPTVCFQSFWNVYGQLITAFRALPRTAPLTEALENAEQGAEVDVPLISGLRDLRYGDAAVGELGYVYYGGLDNPSVITDEEQEEELRDYADFSD